MSGLQAILRRVNLRHLAGRRLRTSLTVGGVVAGVALVFTVAVINATLSSSFRTTLRTLAGQANLEVTAADDTGLPEQYTSTIDRVPGVAEAVPAMRAVSALEGPRGERRTLVLGITPGFTSLFAADQALTVSGGFGSDGAGLVLADGLARALGVTRGDLVQTPLPDGVRPLRVTGLVTGSETRRILGGNLALMRLGAAQRTFAKPDRIDYIWVRTAPGASSTSVRNGIDRALAGAAVVGLPGERARGFERTVGAIATITSLAGTVSLFVAMFVVYNAMSMALAERRRELSMLIALGASRRQLFGAFLAEAAIVGTVASAIGTGAGFVVARLMIDRVAESYRALPISPGGPVVVRGVDILVALVGGIAVSLAGAFLPARRVLAVAPIEALRPEAAYEWGVARRRWIRGPVAIATGAGVFAAGVILGILAARFPDSTAPMAGALLMLLAGTTIVLPYVIPAAVRRMRGTFGRAFGPVGRLATDALLKNPGRTTITVGTLLLTASLVVGIGGALDSYESQLRRTAASWYVGAPLYVRADSFTGFVSDQPLPAASVGARLRTIDGVRSVYPMRFGSVDVDGEQTAIYAIPLAQADRDGLPEVSSSFGSSRRTWLRSLADGGVIVSRLTADQRDLSPGDALAMPTSRGKRTFRVGGVFEDLNGFQAMYMEYASYARLFNDDKADQFFIIPESGVAESTIAARLDRFLRATGLPAHVLTRDEIVEELVGTVMGFMSLARGIGLAALLVAIITIANTMFTAVLERRWEFGLERAVGMGRSQLGRSLLLEAGTLGFVGGLGAAVLGAGMAAFMLRSMEAGFSWRVPYAIPWVLGAGILAGGVAVAAAAASYPRRLAVSVPIIEALRFE